MKLIAILLLAASSLSNASDYSYLVKKQRACSQYGDIASDIFTLKNGGKSRSEVESALGTMNEPIYKFMFDYAFNSAQDKKDAYMTVWAKCMDHYRQ